MHTYILLCTNNCFSKVFLKICHYFLNSENLKSICRMERMLDESLVKWRDKHLSALSQTKRDSEREECAWVKWRTTGRQELALCFSLINLCPVHPPIPKAPVFWYQLYHIRWHWIPCHNQSGIRDWHCGGWGRVGRKTSPGSAAAIKMHDRYRQQVIHPALAHGWGGTHVISTALMWWWRRERVETDGALL